MIHVFYCGGSSVLLHRRRTSDNGLAPMRRPGLGCAHCVGGGGSRVSFLFEANGCPSSRGWQLHYGEDDFTKTTPDHHYQDVGLIETFQYQTDGRQKNSTSYRRTRVTRSEAGGTSPESTTGREEPKSKDPVYVDVNKVCLICMLGLPRGEAPSTTGMTGRHPAVYCTTT